MREVGTAGQDDRANAASPAPPAGQHLKDRSLIRDMPAAFPGLKNSGGTVSSAVGVSVVVLVFVFFITAAPEVGAETGLSTYAESRRMSRTAFPPVSIS